jgi:hypothetical protein
VTATNANGCSNFNTVAVTVKAISTSSANLTICPASLPYTWNGLTFSGAGSQTAHLVNAAGCDSAATLNLTVKAASGSSSNLSICPSALPYTWNGLTFNAAGTQTAHFVNSAGCDSAASLTLTLKPVSSSSTGITICQSALPYAWNELIFNAAGTQTAHFENSVGCDSAATLILTVNPSPTNLTVSSSSPSVCDGGAMNLFASSNTPGGGANIVLLNEDFNAATNNWTKINQSTGGTPGAAAWTLRPDGYTPPGAPVMHSNDNSQFYLSNSDAQGNGGHTNTTLQSPAFSTVGYSTATLTFYHLYFNADAFYDRIKVQVSTDGASWSDIYVNSTNVYLGANYGFALQTISLNGYLDQPNVRLRFNYDCFWGFRWGIDNIKVTGTPLNSYSWTSSPEGFTSALQNPAGVVPNTTTEYTVTVSTSNGCAITNSVLVAVSPGPSATISYDGSACTSDPTLTVTHTGTIGGVYTAPAGLVIDAVIGTITRAGSTPGVYLVSYTIAASGSCPQYIATAPVTIASTYEIIASAAVNGTISSPGTSVVCEGANITYSINAGACASIADVLVNGTSVGPVSSYTFTNIGANNSISATFSPGTTQPVLACYQTATFNSATCQWVISGTQPAQPAVTCYQTATFNNTSCSWDITGTQPTTPTAVNCWDDFQFNTTTCTWENTGVQPIQPSAVNCWDDYQFNTISCTWENVGSQPSEPPRVNCWDDFQFNTISCTWVNNGTQPAPPPTFHCWDNYQFSTGSCAWVNIGTEPPAPPRVNCWDNFQFNTISCTWVNNGTQPAPPSSVNCWDNYQFNPGSCTWINLGIQPPSPPRSNCWDDFQFNTVSCTWVNNGTQPAPPSSVNCWDNYQFNPGSCTWVNLGIQPPAPPSVNCWDDFQFNTISCTWVNNGTQPAPPPSVNCWDDYQFNTTTCTWVNIGTQASAPTITPAGAASICSGGSVTLTSGSALNNQWYLNGNILNGQTGSTLLATAAGSYTVATITNGCSSAISNAVEVSLTMYTITVTAGSNGSINPSTGSVACGTNAVYIITPAAGYAVASVLVDGVSAGAVGSYTFNNVSVNHTISATFAIGAFTITASAGANGSVSSNGTTQVAAGGSQVYTITPATCYHIGDVLVNGVSVGAVSTYTFTNVTSNQTISAAFVINVPIPAPAVTGFVNVCPYEGTGTQLTYSITNISPGTTSYTWIVPPTVTIVSGQGTPNLVVRINNGFAVAPNKQIRVTALSSCGNSPQTIFYLAAQLPVTPAPITGNTNICGILGTQSTFTYTIPSVAAASRYIWSAADPNATIISVNGAGANDTVITVSFAAGFATSAITVRAANNCGISGARSISIIRANPSTPGLITGPTNACPHMSPNGTAAVYSIGPGALSYTWTVPGGAVITGQGTTDISFTYPATFTSGSITVTATNGCGTSSVRTKVVTKLTPGTPGMIDVIQTQTCPARIYSYTLSSMPTGAVSVLWTVPAGATILTGAGTSGITVSYPPTPVAGSVTAQGISNCGNGSTRSTPVKLAACAVEPPPAPFAKGSIDIAPPTEAMTVNVYPNPSVNNFNLKVITAEKEIVNVRILDVQGRAYKLFTVLPYQTITIGADLKAGAYLLEVKQGRATKLTKIVKF